VVLGGGSNGSLSVGGLCVDGYRRAVGVVQIVHNCTVADEGPLIAENGKETLNSIPS